MVNNNMVSENNILFYSEELNEDVRQNNNLLTTKEVLTQNKIKEQIHNNSYTYSSIVDTRDYLGCINGNCTKIKCDCKDSNCDCKHSNTNNCTNTNVGTNTNTNSISSSTNDAISKFVDFIFTLFIAIFLFHILYNRKSEQLIYVLGITIIFVFYKIYIVSN